MRTRKRVALVGRTEDLVWLEKRWVIAKTGDGRVVNLAGELGVGKSRLVEEFISKIGVNSQFLVRFQCSDMHGYPILSNHKAFPAVCQFHRRRHPVRQTGEAREFLDSRATWGIEKTS
jgi:predicted ATPase